MYLSGPPMPPRRPLWLKVTVVIAVVAVGLLALIVGVLVPLSQQPRVTLTEGTYTTSGCGAFGPSRWTFTFRFNLVNTGNANGFATVELYLNGQPNIGTYATINFFVPEESQVTEQGVSISSADCGTYSPGVAVVSVAKA